MLTTSPGTQRTSGTRLVALYGNPVNCAMVMSGVVEPGRLERITWTPNTDGSVRQHWQQSSDNGATWETTFNGIYRRVSSRTVIDLVGQ